MCYLDRTFCKFYETCKSAYGIIEAEKKLVCPRALTPQIKEDANKAKLPIAMYTDNPDCYIDINEKE